MFISKEQTKTLTGYDVTAEMLSMAQGIIEAYVGRTEADVEDATDTANLGKATAYQAAYMTSNGDLVFQQYAVASTNAYGSNLSFRPGDEVSPFVAPLAVIACKNLSWRGSRSVNTGKVYGAKPYVGSWFTE